MAVKEEYIRAFDGVIQGIVETTENGDQVVRAFPSRKILGYYRKGRNVTTDFYNKIISRGNTAVSLIFTQK